MKYFRLTILFLILAELFSFCSFLYPVFNKICFIAILFLTLIISLHNIENGIYVLLAELFIGSFGYLFFYEAGGVSISLRMGFFLVIISAWLAKFLISKQERIKFIDNLKKNKLIKYYFALFIFLAWGIIWGIIRRNGINNVFFDSNNYLYFALIFPLVAVITKTEQMKNIFSILIASCVVISLKTLFLLFVFSHKMFYAMEFLYKWMRDFRLGEITVWQGGFYRVFSQSHIYVLIALFFIASGVVITQNVKIKNKNDNEKCKIFPCYVLLYILFLSVILLGMSRSFWVGGFLAALSMYLILVFFIKFPIMGTVKTTLVFILGLAMSVGLIFAIVKFPYPKESVDFSAELLKDRAITLNDEAGSSRWNLLPILTREILNRPILGYGFGMTLTYKSGDPRVLESSPTGSYTTYAFEWGYLDIIYKIGLAGIFVYLILIGKILKTGIARVNANFAFSDLPTLQFGYILGLIAVLGTSIFSPYMNHPLGIGYIILATTGLSIN